MGERIFFHSKSKVKMLYLKFITLIFVVILELVSADVTSISECPKLAARTSTAKDVTDLRIDDIQIIAALGDSAMAGFAMMGINSEKKTGMVDTKYVREFRGSSYVIGGDTDAITLANFIKYYNPNVYGASTSSHLATLCYGPFCIPPMSLYNPTIDKLNAAQSGGMAMNLNYELDYLIPRMKAHFLFSKGNFTAWKMITIQIGSNDQCTSCSNFAAEYATPEAYGKYVEAAVERIRKEIPNTVVNLLSNYRVLDIYYRTVNETDYCKASSFIKKKTKCSCFATPETLESLNHTYNAYNEKLEAIAAKYPGTPGGTFAVIYNPTSAYWNQMFLKKSSKPSVMAFDPNLKIRCPTEDDRLPTTTN
ncbi:hypothetical protein G6F49_010388 [Rhizopus delemar]|nr:hypothetical protein G6F49_010388 [Rhizopus delemar]